MSTSIVTYDAITISPFEMTLHDVKLVKKIQDHSRLTFSGIIPAHLEDTYVRMADEQTAVKLQYKDGEGKVRTLFHGIILKLQIRVDREVYWLEAEAISHTYTMDITPRNRSFQNHSLSIDKVMQHICAAYPKAHINNTFTEKKTLGTYTLQYQETDWQFLGRLASHYHAPLVPISTTAGISVYLGVPEIHDAGKLETTHYRVYKDLAAYKRAVEPGKSGLSEQDFICYEVVLTQVLELGDQVTFKGKKLHVFEATVEMHRGILTLKYNLCQKRAEYKRKAYNSKIIGASIQGKVADVVRDEVKVKLDYDQEWSLKTAHLFPYSTMYASEDQTGWYCMPEKGDDVRIYFPNAKEGEGIALSTVRKKLPDEAVSGGGSTGGGGKSGGSSGGVTTTVVQQEVLQPIVHFDKEQKEDLMANPNTKFLLTRTGQKITFEDDKITIMGADGGAYITLTNGGTIILNSSNKVTIQTSKQIELVSESIMMIGNQIEMKTEEGMGAIKIDQGQVVIKGVEVLMDK